jgi:hypothetical protein
VSAQKVPSSPCPKKYRSFIFLFHSQNLQIHSTLKPNKTHKKTRGGGGGGGGGPPTLPWRKNWHFLYCISKRIGAIFLSFYTAKLLNDYF